MNLFLKTTVLIALLHSSGSWANSGAWLTGDELLRTCQGSDDSYKQGMCAGYILGAADATTIWELWQDLSSNICISSDVKIGTVIDAVVAHMNAHPHELHFDAGSIVLNALIKRYPCRE
ncbi:MAG: Rap1a/Tai family immunity protein [Halioglobus sp.]